MKILVLGGEGQIGKPVCNFFREKGHKVVSFDIKNSEFQDLRYSRTTNQHLAFSECDFVIYLASDVGGAKYLESQQDSYLFIENNLRMMLNIFGQLKSFNKPFIFSSSQMAVQCHSTYGNLKLIGEKMTKALGGMYVRFWNIYGREESGDKSHVITDFIEQAKSGKITCRTDGQEERQFLHVDDLCACLEYLVDNYKDIDKSESIDISSFVWVKIKDIAEICADIFKCKISFSEKKDSTQKNFRNDPKFYALKFWQPKITLKEGILKLSKE
jgi:nucleoside-diphosphate-sugar epimerase